MKEPINLILENLANANLVKDIELVGRAGKILCVGSRGECALTSLMHSTSASVACCLKKCLELEKVFERMHSYLQYLCSSLVRAV